MKSLTSISVIAMFVPMIAFGAQKENPRGLVVVRGDSEYSQENLKKDSARRGTNPVVARTTVDNSKRQTRAVISPDQNQAVKARSGRNTRSVAKPVARSGAVQGTGSAVNVSRAARVKTFEDISKIGNGYMSCRDAYATCMDQFCAFANDTYARCFCSDKFMDFREKNERLDTAVSMLAQFQDNNLNAVDKTAAEVKAMYTASAGEKAIKKDTSASQKLLNSINDILSGKTVVKKNSLNSLGVLDFSGFDNDDIWDDDDSFSFFGESTNISDLEGEALYNRAYKQCSEIIRESCTNDAMFKLARSSYSLMISQDCNIFEKKSINPKRAMVEDALKSAEKDLREARLEEYRAHNSADVLECLDKVDVAMRHRLACGPNYEKCMDYTGLYIDATTGEPLWEHGFFGLSNLIVLDGTADVLKANSNYDKWLDKETKKFAETALDSCRDISGKVWQEYKRSALIQIAQAQDNKIQEVKDSCVEAIKECYDEKSDTLYDMATTEYTEWESTRGIAAVAARGACYNRVLNCAALYGDPDGCKYDDRTKKITNASGSKKCGLASLLAYVDTIDSVKVAEGCELALRNYAHQLCDPKVGAPATDVYPMGCSTMPKATLRAKMEARRKTFCPSTLVENDTSNTLLTANDVDAFNTNLMNQIINDIYEELGMVFTAGCEELGGEWAYGNTVVSYDVLNQDFYNTYYGRTVTSDAVMQSLNLPEVGYCIIAGEGQQCAALGFDWNVSTQQCTPTETWYETMCGSVFGGTWDNTENSCSVSMSNIMDMVIDVE